MIGELSALEIESLPHGEVIARIGCHSDGHTYVVPSHGLDAHARALNRKAFSIFRIALSHKTGRFERPEAAL